MFYILEVKNHLLINLILRKIYKAWSHFSHMGDLRGEGEFRRDNPQFTNNRSGESGSSLKEKIFIWGLGLLITIPAVFPLMNFSRDYELRKRVLIKADTNNDRVLQNKELGTLLRDLGSEYTLPDNQDVSIRVRNYTGINYDGVQRTIVSLDREEVEKYLNE